MTPTQIIIVYYLHALFLDARCEFKFNKTSCTTDQCFLNGCTDHRVQQISFSELLHRSAYLNEAWEKTALGRGRRYLGARIRHKQPSPQSLFKYLWLRCLGRGGKGHFVSLPTSKNRNRGRRCKIFISPPAAGAKLTDFRRARGKNGSRRQGNQANLVFFGLHSECLHLSSFFFLLVLWIT